jgi:hypothetical protein
MLRVRLVRGRGGGGFVLPVRARPYRAPRCPGAGGGRESAGARSRHMPPVAPARSACRREALRGARSRRRRCSRGAGAARGRSPARGPQDRHRRPHESGLHEPALGLASLCKGTLLCRTFLLRWKYLLAAIWCSCPDLGAAGDRAESSAKTLGRSCVRARAAMRATAWCSRLTGTARQVPNRSSCARSSWCTR